MTDKIATQVAMERRQRESDRRRTTMEIEEFTHRWGPNDKVALAQFTASLHRLMRTVSIEAQQPFINAAARELASVPLSPVVLRALFGRI